MLVGDTTQFTAVDELGNRRADVISSLNNSTLATISSNSSTVVTATAPGTLTLTATVEGVPAQAQITIEPAGTILPSGTVLWSDVPPAGYAVGDAIQDPDHRVQPKSLFGRTEQ